MRTYSLLFIVVTLIVVVLMVVNGGNLLRPSDIVIPFAGTYRAPVRLIGLLSLIGVAGAYSLAWSLSSTRSQAKSANYLRQIEDLRKSIDKEEAGRFASLKADLERHFSSVLTRLETAPAAQASGGAPADRLVQALGARVDRIRDELAADIGASEDAILRAIEGKIALGDVRMIEADRPKRLP